MHIDEAIRIATREVKDVSGLTYLRAIPKAIEMYGTEGFHSQLYYVLPNMRSWQGELAREVKATIKKYLKESVNA